MATPVLIPVFTPVQEYLDTTYHPDCDYIDGVVKERNLGEKQHSTLQGFLVVIFHANRKTWSTRAFTEQRVQINPERFRIPDVCVLPLGEPPDPIIRSAPLICIEILSRDDTPKEMQERFVDYLALGVENIWLLDPIRRRAWSVGANGAHHVVVDEFVVAGTPIRVALADLYLELDELAAGR